MTGLAGGVFVSVEFQSRLFDPVRMDGEDVGMEVERRDMAEGTRGPS